MKPSEQVNSSGLLCQPDAIIMFVAKETLHSPSTYLFPPPSANPNYKTDAGQLAKTNMLSNGVRKRAKASREAQENHKLITTYKNKNDHEKKRYHGTLFGLSLVESSSCGVVSVACRVRRSRAGPRPQTLCYCSLIPTSLVAARARRVARASRSADLSGLRDSEIILFGVVQQKDKRTKKDDVCKQNPFCLNL